MNFRLNRVRLSFPNLWHLAQVGDGKPSYGAAFLLGIDDPQVAKLNEVIEQVAKEKWKDKAPLALTQLRAQDRVCLHNGDLKADYDGYPGNWYVSSRCYSRPLVIDRTRQELKEEDGIPYGGCYVNASIDVYAQDSKEYGRRINATLKGVQFVADGVAFAGGPPAKPEDFEMLDEGDLA